MRKQKTASRVRAPGSIQTSRVLILLEQIKSQQRAILEAVHASEKRIRDDFKAR